MSISCALINLQKRIKLVKIPIKIDNLPGVSPASLDDFKTEKEIFLLRKYCERGLLSS